MRITHTVFVIIILVAILTITGSVVVVREELSSSDDMPEFAGSPRQPTAGSPITSS